MLYQCWLSIIRRPLKLIRSILLFVILYFIFSQTIFFNHHSLELTYALINMTALMVTSCVDGTNSAVLQLMRREKKLFHYCLANLLINTLLFFIGICCIIAVTLNVFCITALLPIMSLFLNNILLDLVNVSKSADSNLNLLIAFPLTLPVILASVLTVAQQEMAIYFLTGWILVHLALLAILCSQQINRIINLA